MHRALKLLLAISLFLGIFFVIFYHFEDSKHATHIVTLTEDGFSPKTLNITEGDTVQFMTTQSKSFWPASDSHPSHGILPDFDPKQAILSTDSWEFTFTVIGSWEYHDHLASQYTGVINVYTKFGETTKNCLKRDVNYIQKECWIEEFKKIHNIKGFDGVFETFATYQKNDAQFGSNCHDIMHLIGDFAYEEYERTGEVFDQPGTSYCGFGFYHGFIERMIAETGDYTKSRKYCEQLVIEGDYESESIAWDAEAACVHGFGHAIFDSLDGSLWGNTEVMVDAGIATCEQVFEGDYYQAECGTGIWNALANALSGKVYNLSFTKDTLPFDVCKKARDIYKPGCYVEMVVQFSTWNDNDLTEDFRIMREEVEPIAQPKTYFAYMANQIQWEVSYDYNAIAALSDMCAELAAPEMFRECQIGIHYGVLKLTTPYTNKEESGKICGAYTTPERQAICRETIPDKLRDSTE